MVATMSIYLDTGGAVNAPANEDDIDGLGPQTCGLNWLIIKP